MTETEKSIYDVRWLFKMRDEEERIGKMELKDLAAGEESFSHMIFSGTSFINCRFWQCSFKRAEFTDVLFQGCDFSGCNFGDAYFSHVTMNSCKGMGAGFIQSRMNCVTIDGCNLNYSSFDQSVIKKMTVKDTELASSNFAQCICKDMVWNKVNLTNTSFFKTSLFGMDFTDSTIEGLILSDENTELRGAIVDLYQAAELSKRMGVVIR